MNNIKERLRRLAIWWAIRFIIKLVGWKRTTLDDGSEGWAKTVANGTEYKGTWRFAVLTSLDKINFFK